MKAIVSCHTGIVAIDEAEGRVLVALQGLRRWFAYDEGPRGKCLNSSRFSFGSRFHRWPFPLVPVVPALFGSGRFSSVE
jgi:hypothetical protein